MILLILNKQMSNSQSQRIIDAKNQLNDSLKKFWIDYPSCQNKTDVTGLIGELTNQHSSILTAINQVLSDVHQERDFFSETNLRQEYLGTVENFIAVSLKLNEVIRLAAQKNQISGRIVSDKSYNTVQSFINTFASADVIKKFKEGFQKNNISLEGFNQKFKKTMKKKYLYIQLWVGIPLLLICGFIIFFGEHYLHQRFNGIQLIFLKALLSLSTSAVGSSVIEGTANINWKMQTALTVRAAGWVAIFLLLYFLNPASPSQVTG